MYSPVPQQYRKARIQPADLLVVGLFIFFLYGTVVTAQRWNSALQPDVNIHLDLAHLLLYSVYSLFRAAIAYIFSLLFTLFFGYLAAKYKTAESVILPLLDIGQSIPVLGFLPGLVLGLIAIFPQSNLGLELACILMIFTGQVWNMTFSFYSSVKAVPKHFHELSQNVHLGFFQKLFLVELPYASTGLAWNSLMSMAGGWFFLTVCEAFTLGDKHFRLPGLGSFMAVAIEKGDRDAMILGVICMTFLIVGMDFFIWRPIIAWTRRFQLDEQQDHVQEIPYFQKLIQESKIVRKIESLFLSLFRHKKTEYEHHEVSKKKRAHPASRTQSRFREWFDSLQESKVTQFIISKLSWIIFSAGGVWISGKMYGFFQSLSLGDVLLILLSTLKTFLRIAFTLVISTLWAVPFGIWVGSSPKRMQLFQPVIQVAASFPAPMIYPVVLGVLSFFDIGINFGSSILMLIGVQWYVLFNVLAGTTMISRELRDTFSIIGLSRRELWKKLYLPSIFPSLVTGWVIAAGGAWNASIVAEYILYKGETMKADGLGALISDATARGNYPVLAASLVCMVIIVVSFNRLVWHRLYQLIEKRYKFER